MYRVRDGDIGLIINNRIQTPLYTSVVTVIWQVGNCFFSTCNKRAVCFGRIKQLINTNAHTRFYALRNSIDTAFDA
ncbi:Uncharacterised protein [Escherichia coli]|uniref:Uncharacterized protein n=1 Tax=Escherichia coli TaxID=562 RepID=A0A377DH87_ECOLX|nr:Uncharacterised protein [Escherichia coli]